MHHMNENSSPIEPGQQVHPPQKPPGRPRGTLLLLGLAILALLGAGVVTGWQLGAKNSSGGTSQLQATVPALNSSNLDAVREAVVNKVRPSVVQINVKTAQGGGLGSGVIIDSRGYIVTNNHVIEGGQQIQVEFFNGTTLPAEITGTAPMDDLAVIKVNPGRNRLAVAALGDSSKLEVGQDVLAVGNPLGITQTVTAGIVSALNRTVGEGSNDVVLPDTIQTDAAINPGNSGGALVDLQGNLIGIPTLTAIDPEFKTPANGVGFAIPINRARFIVPQLINSGKVTNTGRAALNIQVTDVDATMANQYNLPVKQGVLVVNVTPGGAADKAGLKPNDIIVQVDNVATLNQSALNGYLLTKSPGDKVTVRFFRGNQQQSATVTLGELPAP